MNKIKASYRIETKLWCNSRELRPKHIEFESIKK
jgi:hypothetical protein